LTFVDAASILSYSKLVSAYIAYRRLSGRCAIELRSPTIEDVAHLAGVSTATVSRALNGGPIAAATRARVTAAVAQLRFQRNAHAQSLASGRSRTVGVVVPDVAGPLYAQMARGVEDVLEPLNLQFFLVTDNRSPEFSHRVVGSLLERRVDGLILIGNLIPTKELEKLLAGGPATVTIEREGDATPFDAIDLDNYSGARLATSHLIERGHRCIAHICVGRRAGRERLAGYNDALADANLAAGPIIEADFTEAAGYQAGKTLLTLPQVSAVFCGNDRIALGLMRASAEQGVQIGTGLSVVGFDDLPFSPYLNPPLTTIRQDARSLGQRAAKHLLQILDKRSGPTRTPIATELVIRASVGDPPATVTDEHAAHHTRSHSRRKV
jgi:LacI family transcriptional regulator